MYTVNDVMPIRTTHLLDNLVVMSRNIVLAVICTLCLLYAMYLLVHQDFPDVTDEPPLTIPTMTMRVPKEIPVELPQLPVRPVEIVRPSTIELMEPPSASEPGTGGIVIDPIKPITPGITEISILNGQILPFVKVAPVYPSVAATKGIEGYVDVMFDVTEVGTTTNIRVIGFFPSTIFNKSVVKAVKGWKYKPNVVDGNAMKTVNVKERIRFNLDK